MLFNSYIFILLFLPLAVLGYYLLNRLGKYHWGKAYLIGMSLWFYAFFNLQYLWIIIASIIINFVLYRVLLSCEKQTAKKLLVVLGIVLNISVLFYYKYFDFVLENIGALLHSEFDLMKLVLPLGISFFTFQQVGFLVDTYRGETKQYSLLDYALFVTFFPQLIAGPIVSYDEMIPQFMDETKKTFSQEDFSKGLYAFALGLGKKVLIADILGNAVNAGYSDVAGLSGITAALSVMCYSLQLYFDFSGYSDMARGIGLMFRIQLPANFLSPYKSTDLIGFWKGWHITLTRFLTKYVYIPLGGSRKGNVRTYVNIAIVYLVSGIWHGAAWTFIFWGVCHGLVYMFCRAAMPFLKKIPAVILWPVNMAFVMLGWGYFRAASLSEGNMLTAKIFSGDYSLSSIPENVLSCFASKELFYVLKVVALDRFAWFPYVLPIFYLVVSWWIVLGCKNVDEKLKEFKPTIRNSLGTMFLLLWSLVSLGQVSTFLYFNF